MFSTFNLLLIMCLGCVSVGRVLPPRRTAVIGETVQFSCEFDQEALWKFSGGRLPQRTKTYESDTGIQKVSTLRMEDVQLNNTGTYTCLEIVNNGVKIVGHGTLTVTGKILFSRIQVY